LENDEITEIETQREFGNEKNKLIIQPTGILVIELLIEKYPTLFDYEYTKNMEDVLDIIAKGEKNYYDLCNDCLNLINQTPSTSKSEIKIDNNHSYIIAKNGPVIKKNINNKIEFLSVKPDINIEDLKNGKLRLEDIRAEDNLNKNLGTYQNETLFLKKGKFGLYVIWGNNKKSLENINIKENDITINDVIKFIENTTNTNIIRILNKNLSIRKGQFGNYIFYKTNKMTKPMFYKLNGFDDDYNNCNIQKLLDWIKETYNV